MANIISKREFMELVENVFSEREVINVSDSVLRGLQHFIITDEVKKAIKQLDLNGKDYRVIKNTVAKVLDRNDQQIGYYLSELRDSGEIDYTTACYSLSEKALAVLTAVYKLGGMATLSEISKETGLVWSSIRSTLYGRYMREYTAYSTSEQYDNRGRIITTVSLNSKGRKYCEEIFKMERA